MSGWISVHENKGARRDVLGDRGGQQHQTPLYQTRSTTAGKSRCRGTEHTAWEQRGCDANEIPPVWPCAQKESPLFLQFAFYGGVSQCSGDQQVGMWCKACFKIKRCGLCVSEIFSVAPLLCEPASCLPGSSHGHCTQVLLKLFCVWWNLPPPSFSFLFLVTQVGWRISQVV